MVTAAVPRQSPRAGELGGARCVGRHVGAVARKPSPPSSGPPAANSPPGLRAPPLPADAAAPPPIPPAGFTVDLAPPGDLRAALVGRAILYWWPEDGWQRGTVAHLCLRGQRGTFLHVVAYMRETSALRGTADALLVAASCFRWVLLSPVPGAGVVRPPDSAASVRRSGRSPQP